jgi:CHAD domain-containing protein
MRDGAWDAAVAAIDSRSFQKFLDDLSHALEACIWRRESADIDAFTAKIAAVAAKTLDKRMKKARKRAKHLETLSRGECHKLRIALKKTRYAADFFRPLHDAKDAARFLGHLSKMQDILGALNDVEAARLTLAKLIEAEPEAGGDIARDIHFAAGIVYGWHLDRATRDAKKAAKHWKKIHSTEPYWRQ